MTVQLEKLLQLVFEWGDGRMLLFIWEGEWFNTQDWCCYDLQTSMHPPYCQAKLRPKVLRSRDPRRNLRRQRDSYILAAISCHCKRKNICSGADHWAVATMKKRMARFKLYRILGLQPGEKADKVGGQHNKIFSRRIYMKMGFSFHRREMLFFLTTNGRRDVKTSLKKRLCVLWNFFALTPSHPVTWR